MRWKIWLLLVLTILYGLAVFLEEEGKPGRGGSHAGLTICDGGSPAAKMCDIVIMRALSAWLNLKVSIELERIVFGSF